MGLAPNWKNFRIPDSKRRLFKHYQEAFRDIEGISLFVEPEVSHSNYWLQALLLDGSTVSQRDAILEATNSAGLMTRPAWTLCPIYFRSKIALMHHFRLPNLWKSEL